MMIGAKESVKQATKYTYTPGETTTCNPAASFTLIVAAVSVG
jgi:hypothetical protein